MTKVFVFKAIAAGFLSLWISACQAKRHDNSLLLLFALKPSVSCKHYSVPPMPCASGPYVEGVDVSQFQGSINWPLVKADGKGFALTRVADGLTVDTNFTTNYSGIKSAGLIRGAYQFFHPELDASAQATLYINSVGSFGQGDLPPILDVETTGGKDQATILSRVDTWVTAVKQTTGRTPVIYTSKSFWDASVTSQTSPMTTLWVGHYGVACPNLPTAWSAWEFWQYSTTGTVNGITATGATDLDRFNGSSSDLESLADCQ